MKRKRLWSLLLAMGMAFSVAIPTAAAETGYDDVDSAAWYADAVRYMTNAGLMNGVGDGKFDPDGTFTRAQLATVLYRMAGSPAVTGTDSFSDTQDTAWYATAVTWAEQNSVVNGIGNGQFGPGNATTQEQLVTMLWRNAGEPQGDAADDASNWAANAVGWARAEGLTDGAELAFAPKADASRAQIAVIVSRYLQAKDDADNRNENPVAAAKKALVIYFSAADNDGIDAVSAATVVAHEGEDYGAAQLAAKFVGDYTGADVSAIVTEQSYPAEYNAMADMAKAQRDNGEHPALTSKIENLADYDTVFLVYPVWWYTVPMPIYSLLDEYDFSGKTIIPVITHEGSGDGGTLSVLRAEEPNATVLDAFTSRFGAVPTQKAAVESWLDGLTAYWK